MPEVTLNQISKTMGKTKVLDNVSLKIDEGTFVCLLGPTGAGKTTLLKIIAGLTTPTEGAVYFNNADVTMVGPNKRNVSMVFEDFALYPHMSVFKNIASPLIAKKLSKSEIEGKVKEVTKFLKIDRFLDRKINQLSGGEMQRVAIGRALAKDAQIVLFDEIFVNLDYKLREQMRVEFKELMDRVKLTTIFSSPDPEDALSLADKIAVMQNGSVLQYDVKDMVYNQPVNVFTGEYFGYPEMNFVDCTVTEKDGALELDAGFFKALVTNDYMKKNLKIGPCSMGIRPEHIRISEQPANMGIESKGSLMLTEVIGSDTIVHVEMDGSSTLEVFTPGIYRKDIGEQIYLSFDLELIYLFEKDTGQLIGRGV
jgi:ABC-type sugar transport system ATPase subunit